jgi:hypothetical protein
LDAASGTVIGLMHRRHRAIESKKFVAKIDAEVPADLDLYLVCGNQSTHKTPAVPTSSSWLNQVERWFGPLTDKKLRRGVHKSATVLENDIQSWIKNWNGHPRPFTWTRPPTRSSNGSRNIFNGFPAQDISPESMVLRSG